jgi:hypothetical protein
MNTVDLAAYSIAKERGLLDQVQLVRPWGCYNSKAPNYRREVEETDRWPMRFSYAACLDDPEPASNLLFWGDFQHGWDYQRQSAKRLMAISAMIGHEVSFDQCFNWCMKHFMLEGDSLLGAGGRVGVYGSTLFQNRLRDYDDLRYNTQLTKLYRCAEFARVRDPYSAWKVASIRDEFSTQFLAPDAAILNRIDDIIQLEQASPLELNRFDGAIGIYFGRSEGGFPWLGAAQFINSLRSSLRADLVWVPWDRHAGSLFAPINRTLSWMLPSVHKMPASVEMTPGDTLNSIRRLQLVVTDTYHLAINCLIQGIPAVCIHEPSPNSSRNANMGYRESARDKRALLYMAHDLVELLVPSTDFQSRKFRNIRVETIADLVRTRAELGRSFESLRRHADYHRASVGDYMQSAVREPN